MPKFSKHIFICMNQREPGHPRGCCDAAGQGELQLLFKVKLARRGIKLVRANKSGCLDQCELGPTVAVYPESRFMVACILKTSTRSLNRISWTTSPSNACASPMKS